MVRDLTLPEKMRAEGKALIEAGSGLLKEADRLERINRGETFQKKSVNWKTADDIEDLLLDGRTMERSQLETILVEGGFVDGATDDKKKESAKVAITVGLTKGYLKETPSGIAWVPGIRKSKVKK